MKFKLNKKIVLTSMAIPVAIATPISVVVSCGVANESTIKNLKPQIQTDRYSEKQLSQYSATPYSKNAIKGVYSSFLNTMKFTENFKGKLKLQALKVTDLMVISLLGYLRENDSANAGSDDSSSKIKLEHIKKLKAAKLHFSENLKKLKVQVDELFNLIAMGDNETIIGDLFGSVADKQETPISSNSKETKEEATKETKKDAKKESSMVLMAKLAFGKLKLVLDNVIDTLINIEHPNSPTWKTESNVEKIGSLKELENSSVPIKNASTTANITNTDKLELSKKIHAFLDGNLTKAISKQLIRSFKTGGVDIVEDYSNAMLMEASIAKEMVKPIDQPENAINDNGFKSGLKFLKKIAKDSPDKLIIYRNSVNKNIYFEIDTTAHDLINTARQNIKYNEKHVGALLEDGLLNDVLIGPMLKSKDTKTKMPSSETILGILGHPEKISGLLSKVDSMLGDFGKALQLTELDLQAAISNISGNQAQYYGQIDFDAKLKSYKMQKNAFISPQFNIFDIKNYGSNNNKIKEGIKNKKITEPHIKKEVNGINVDIPILEFIDKLTVDPYSNYTFSLMELALALKLKDVAL
ncbi:hypothetical protein MYMA111404_00880 [Mycoplasma marinum]|uniref:Lipoprotein n=1 Tax=Mycoplasma marinum TaxID=1937190 RepID=A0A4R0XQW5_9MOLU|nr:hypothetical protein [Mycoplasma marinum]TCG11990.1 hypothetical protein C4B24_00035 [Mycoplasma marinum]